MWSGLQLQKLKKEVTLMEHITTVSKREYIKLQVNLIYCRVLKIQMVQWIK